MPDVRFDLSLLPTLRNAVSAVADEVWQYRTGGNLTIFDKDHDTAIAKVLAAKHTASLQLLCTVGGNQARSDARSEFKKRVVIKYYKVSTSPLPVV